MVSLSTLYAYQKTTYKVVLLFAPTPVRLVWTYPIMTLQIDSKRKTMGGDAPIWARRGSRLRPH